MDEKEVREKLKRILVEQKQRIDRAYMGYVEAGFRFNAVNNETSGITVRLDKKKGLEILYFGREIKPDEDQNEVLFRGVKTVEKARKKWNQKALLIDDTLKTWEEKLGQDKGLKVLVK